MRGGVWEGRGGRAGQGRACGGGGEDEEERRRRG